jgi:hypothetical protein
VLDSKFNLLDFGVVGHNTLPHLKKQLKESTTHDRLLSGIFIPPQFCDIKTLMNFSETRQII